MFLRFSSLVFSKRPRERRTGRNLGTEKVPQKKRCDKDFAERSGELSGVICLKTLVLLGNHR